VDKRIRRVLRTSIVIVFYGTLGLSQTQPSVKQEAKDTSCSNIVALAGNVSVNCSSLTPAQRKLIQSIPAVLNKILANQLDPEAVMRKLDEILHAINPNLPVKTYFCDGTWRSAGPGAHAALDINMGGSDAIFQEMVRLNNSQQYGEVFKVCLAQIEKVPEWLTPRLFCAVAYLETGEASKAKNMLADFESRAGPAYSDGACKQMSDFLHERLP
jgi:hypothetical protein